MGIVVKQSIRNTIITYVGFVIGAANAMFFYPHILGKTFYGLTSFLLSSGNIIMPLMAFGVHNTMVKFYSGFSTEEEKSKFLTFMVLLPTVIFLPLALTGIFWYEPIAHWLAHKNPIIHDYVWQIPVIGLCMGYFEIFYAWVKVHMKSVFGSFIKEVLLRVLITLSLFAVYLHVMTIEGFILATTGIYFVMMMIMVVVALRVRMPSFSLHFPFEKRAVLVYTVFIIISGTVAGLLLELDKFMLSQYINIDNVAYYNVAIFMTTAVAVPSRAMHQIAYPITARLMSENKHDELNDFYKKTSITLQIVGGYVFLGILVNLNQVYKLMPAGYEAGAFVVFVVGVSRYFDLVLGNNNAIIFNSVYYRMVLFLGLLLAVVAVGLNMLLIPRFGIRGSAVATLIAIFLYSLSKLMFVVLRMKLYPFTRQTLQAIGVSLVTFFVFYFWDFGWSPLVNIILKAVLVTVFYGAANYILKLSPEINAVIDRMFAFFRRA